MWGEHFKSILNCSTSSCTNNVAFLQRLNSFCNSDFELFTEAEIQSAIQRLKRNSSPGKDGLSCEHFIYADDSLNFYLRVLFNCMLTHNYIPQELMDSLIVPLLKDKKGDITDKDNYRPIAITCVISKILESVLLEKHKDYFNTSFHQFGYKPKHSTDQCIFIMRELIDYFNASNSPLYIYLLLTLVKLLIGWIMYFYLINCYKEVFHLYLSDFYVPGIHISNSLSNGVIVCRVLLRQLTVCDKGEHYLPLCLMFLWTN